MTIFFTSDTHFGHANILKYCWESRGLAFPGKSFEEVFAIKRESIKAHDEFLIRSWNSIVSPEDTVYHLGDVAFGKFDMNKLNGTKILIEGNHDPKHNPGFKEIHEHLSLRLDHPHTNEKIDIVLSHFPFEDWDRKHHGVLHFHGHKHGTLPYRVGFENRLDLGVDCWDMRPVSIVEILARIEERTRKVEMEEVFPEDDFQY